jgi:hypothetical protein
MSQTDTRMTMEKSKTHKELIRRIRSLKLKKNNNLTVEERRTLDDAITFLKEKEAELTDFGKIKGERIFLFIEKISQIVLYLIRSFDLFN